MEYKIFFTVFTAVFIAELGDKTQLATLLFATDKEASKLAVFWGASLALVAATAIAVVVGSMSANLISDKALRYMAGIGFVSIGIWTLFKA